MKFIKTFLTKVSSFWKTEKKTQKHPLFGIDYKQAILIKHGKEQFISLMKKGLGVPVVLL